jgi:hypothetical protein
VVIYSAVWLIDTLQRGFLYCKVLTRHGQVAQLVERGPEKAGVGGSIPSLATISFNNLAIGKKCESFSSPNNTPTSAFEIASHIGSKLSARVVARTRNFQLGNQNSSSFIFTTQKTVQQKSKGMQRIPRMQYLMRIGGGRFPFHSCTDKLPRRWADCRKGSQTVFSSKRIGRSYSDLVVDRNSRPSATIKVQPSGRNRRRLIQTACIIWGVSLIRATGAAACRISNRSILHRVRSFSFGQSKGVSSRLASGRVDSGV